MDGWMHSMVDGWKGGWQGRWPCYCVAAMPHHSPQHPPWPLPQERDSEGFSLHGGPITPDGRFNPTLQYRCEQGQLWTSLLAVSFQLSDHNPGDGGFCVLRGSHKLNLPVPADVANGVDDAFDEHVYQPTTKAGDVIIWSEATVHGVFDPLSAQRTTRTHLRARYCEQARHRGAATTSAASPSTASLPITWATAAAILRWLRTKRRWRCSASSSALWWSRRTRIVSSGLS